MTFKPEAFGIGNLFHRISDAVVVADASTETVVLWNRSAERLFGYPSEEAVGMALHCLVPDELRQRHRAGVAHYQKTGTGDLVGTGHPIEVEAVRKDGTRVAIELSLTAVEAQEQAGTRYALALIRDATERKIAEEARVSIREAEIQRRQALELHDTVVQGLAGMRMALDLDEIATARSLLDRTLEQARSIVRGLLDELHPQGILPGDLVREKDVDGSRTENP